MYDFLKTITHHLNFDQLKDRLGTPFISRIDLETGELRPHYDKFGITSYWHTATLNEIKFSVNERIQGNKKRFFLITQGSIHKNHFKGANFNDFTFGNAKEQIENLCKLTAIKPKDFILQNLEFGVNIQTPFEPIKYLNKNLITDKGKPFNKYGPDKNNVSIGYEHKFRQYHKKVYDKGLQYGLNDNLMRFELSYKKMYALNKLGIYNLENLTNPYITPKLEPLLLRGWNEILFNDSINTKLAIKKRDSLFLRTANNPKFWEQSKTDKTYREKRRKFKKLQKANCSGTQDQLKEQIKAKFQHLISN